MDKTFFQKIWAGIVAFSRRVADFVAHLTNWQFVFLAVLALVGAGILQSILESRSTTRLIPPVSVTVKKDAPKSAIKHSDPDSPEPARPPADPLEDVIKKKILIEIQKGIDNEADSAATAKSIKKEILKEVQKDLNSESEIDEPASAKAKQPKRSVRVQIGDFNDGKGDRDLPIAQMVFFLIVILLAVRITTRSRQRAEKRVLSAEASAEVESLRRQVTEAQLQTLQAQVEPHFLFNTLAAVEHLTETDAPRATVMLQHLIAFLRGSLPDMREQNTTLGREVDLCRSYLAIMQIRMEDRLKVSIDVPESLRGLSFPPMMLQSLVENSIKHGLEPKPEGGAIAISARLQDGRLRVTVADSGLGIAENAPQGIGLGNIRDRLKRLFGNSAALVLAPNAPAGAHITIEIPHVPAPASDTGG